MRLIAVMLILFPSLCFADNQSEEKFSKEEVRVNIAKFINTVFGKEPPTLADRIKFEGGESLEGDETLLEYEVCKQRYKTADPANSKECDEKFLDPRIRHPDQVESLYYRRLRTRLGVVAYQLKIESVTFVKSTDGVDGYFLVVVGASDQNRSRKLGDSLLVHKQLLLWHAGSPQQAAEGMISVQAVTVPIHEYVMPELR